MDATTILASMDATILAITFGLATGICVIVWIFCRGSSDEHGRYKSGLESGSLYQFYDDDKVSDGTGENANRSTLERLGKSGKNMRVFWIEMPEVISSGILNTMSPEKKKLQESMFEIITSEATYLKSLNVFIDVFRNSDELGCDSPGKGVLTKQERHMIFSNIDVIRNTSEKFLLDLERRWRQSVELSDICDIITAHTNNHFDCYAHYCSNQTFQARTVTDLKKKPKFLNVVTRLENHTDCQRLTMFSFLMLPVQRIPRLQLLATEIGQRSESIDANDTKSSAGSGIKVLNKDEIKASAMRAVTALCKIARKSDDGVRRMQQTEQIIEINKQIDFPKTIAKIPLISSSRYLVKHGKITRIVNESASRGPFGTAKPIKKSLRIYLFNDVLLLTKKKGDRYKVIDYGQRNKLHIQEINNPDNFSTVLPLGVPSGCDHLFLLVMLDNHEKQEMKTVFACDSTSDRARWVEALTPVEVTLEQDEQIYENWDCPQVQCVERYTAQETDELSLELSDVVNVFKKLKDGMYEGERIRDGERGWFPSQHTVEIENDHVRARNMRIKHNLRSALADYGRSQRR